MKPPTTPRAVIYCRVTTGEQAVSGLGLESQEAACRASAAALGLPVAAVHRDGGKAGDAPADARPGLLAALAEVRRGDAFVVMKRDRLGRDPLLMLLLERELEKKGSRLVSSAGEGTADDEPSSILLRRVLDAVSEHERLVIALRTRGAMAAARVRGQKTGGSDPFGFKAEGGQLVALPEEQAVIERARALRAAGKSYVAIAEALNADGIKTKGGKAWTWRQVTRILNRERNRAWRWKRRTVRLRLKRPA